MALTLWQATHSVRNTFAPFSALPRGGSAGAGAASVFRYASICQTSRSDVRGATNAGISELGTPRRMVLNRPSSVRPELQTWVMSGPRTPRPSVPWQSAQRRRKPPMPARMASGFPSRGFLVWAWSGQTALPTIRTQETTTAENTRHVMAAILHLRKANGFALRRDRSARHRNAPARARGGSRCPSAETSKSRMLKSAREMRQLTLLPGDEIDEPEILVPDVPAHHQQGASIVQKARDAGRHGSASASGNGYAAAVGGAGLHRELGADVGGGIDDEFRSTVTRRDRSRTSCDHRDSAPIERDANEMRRRRSSVAPDAID